ncbi:purine nucleoside phosphorylase [Insulibacter thermoxylanivorax]|uniref:Purine nucleoside phosphorylase n=1 Tax=Insulibacter thermoxylanivorax TaxID=2749268 RepID=A0A916Q9S0_9BACL|nr:purine-nucleoside phosphorylase [Insulibacter thermoxylanivorax]GFR36821.1 purine nucleoside phosphorylase [Insulibacter thermoxylanivorax]
MARLDANQGLDANQLQQQLKEAAEFIRGRLSGKPEIGLILGSGLGVLADLIEQPLTIPYGEIPHFPVSTVAGHSGELVIGAIAGRQVIMMKGRFHLYEGYGEAQVTFPVRVMKLLGIEKLIVTNAAGGVNRSFQPGDLMMITDHINLMGRNPLIGPNLDEFGPRFPDMTEAYSRALRKVLKDTADELGIQLQEGVYAAMLGPAYETPAEIRMLQTIGADAVGMSTVPEVIVARHAGIEVLGISCITNMAAGLLDQPLRHDEVVETAERVKEQFLKLVLNVIPKL